MMLKLHDEEQFIPSSLKLKYQTHQLLRNEKFNKNHLCMLDAMVCDHLYLAN